MTKIERQEIILHLDNPSVLFMPAYESAAPARLPGDTIIKQDRRRACPWECMIVIMRDFI